MKTYPQISLDWSRFDEEDLNSLLLETMKKWDGAMSTMLHFTWQTIASGSAGPGPRSRHGLVYDRRAGATILFGGVVYRDHWYLKSDTWELKHGRWSQVDTLERPRPRHRGAMAYDDERGITVLFGGQDGVGQILGDTWTYADGSWHRPRTSWFHRPNPRCGHAMAFDESSRQVVLFGGIDSSDSPLGDTWVFDGSSWRAVRSDHPPARRYPSLAYDPRFQGCVLHGGAVDDRGAELFGDAWLFRGGAWGPLPVGFETDARDDHGLAYHRAAKTLVMLEGINAPRDLLVASSDGWEPAYCKPIHPQHQCSPMTWDDRLNGLVLHGGEQYHAGPQYDSTLVLRIA